MKRKMRKKHIVRCLHRLTIGEGEAGATGTPGAGGEGQPAGGTSGQAGAPAAAGTSGQQSSENNSPRTANPWQISDTIKQSQQPGQPAPNATQAPAATPTPAEQQQTAEKDMAQFITGLKLTNGVDLTKLQEEIADGRTDSLDAAFSMVASNVFQQSMVQANRLVQNNMQAMVKEAVAEATSTVHSNMAERELGDKFSFTKDPAIAPIAKAALASFMKMPGMDEVTAVAKTGEFFKQMLQHVGTTQRDFMPPPSGPGGQPFGGVGDQYGNNQSPPDWMDILAGGTGGPPQT